MPSEPFPPRPNLPTVPNDAAPLRTDPSAQRADSGRPEIVPSDADGVRRGAARLRAGRLVAMPTETVYGLAARAVDRSAVGRVFAAKGRPADHPLIVHLHDLDALGAWIDRPDDRIRALAERFWPGPLTLIGPRADGVHDGVTGGHPTVAVRMPAHPVARAVLSALGDAVAAPSANRFGHVSPTCARHVADEFPLHDLLILDGGPCAIGLESTIVDLSGRQARLLRPGAIAVSALEDVLGAPVSAPHDASVAAPGRRVSHYAPDAVLRLIDAHALPDAARSAPDAALLLIDAPLPDGHRGPARRLSDHPERYGRDLYAALRALDASGASLLLVQRPPTASAWDPGHDPVAQAAAP
ncbi:MAG: L-threonylcarbamoyladenylate synthase, partial [Trueperaceae bacterium]